MLKGLARHVRDDVLPGVRLRRRHPHAFVSHRVLVSGDPRAMELGPGVAIHGPTVLSCANGGGLTGARLTVGARTYIGELNNIRCAGAPIVIGADCLISQLVTIVGSNHGTVRGVPIASQGWVGDGVVIGDDVWLGAGCTVLPGSRIADGAVVAAGSVVRGEVPADAIVAGTPARQIGSRR